MRRLASYLPAVLVFASGLVAGMWFSIERRVAVAPPGFGHHRAGVATDVAVPARGGARAFATDDEMLTAIMSALVEEEPLLRTHRLHELLGGLSSAELGVLFDRAVQTDDPQRREELLGPLLARWVVVDRAGADTATRPYRNRGHAHARWDAQGLDNVVTRIWAETLPDAALAEAMASPDAPWAWMTAWSAMTTLAGGEAAQQIEILARLPPSHLRAEMAARTILALAGQDPAAAEAALDLVPDARKRSSMQATILGKLAEQNPQAGLARLAALAPSLTPGADSTWLIAKVLQAAAKQDASAALQAIDGLPEELQAQARSSVLVGWASEHPLDALHWAEANGVAVSEVLAPPYQRTQDDGGSVSLLGTALDHDREQTMAWLRAQPASPERDVMFREALSRSTSAEQLQIFTQISPELQAGAVDEVLNNLNRENHDAAVAWTRDLPPGPTHTQAVMELIALTAMSAPDRVDPLLEGGSAGVDRDAVLRGIAAGVAINDPTRALDYARRLDDPTARELALDMVANRWITLDPAAARTWLTSTTDLPTESKRVLLRQLDDP